MTVVVGVDACQGKWLAVVLRDRRFAHSRLAAEISSHASEWLDAVAIGVDIPIGLPATPGRDADRAARAFLGARRSSVFTTFPEDVLRAATYEEAKAICAERGWPKPSLQSFGMRHRILEVESLATNNERVFEAHPEVSFRELAGRPLASKRTALGLSERQAELANVGIELPADLPYPLDDVLDAAVAAWTADRYARGEARPFPSGGSGRRATIWA